MERLPKQIQYLILNKLSLADVFNYMLINSGTNQLSVDQNFYKVRLYRHNQPLFLTKPQGVDWISWFKQSGSLICDNKLVANSVRFVDIDEYHNQTIIYLDHFNNLYVAGNLLPSGLEKVIPNRHGLVNPPYKWLANIKAAEIWHNNLIILNTQGELFTFGYEIEPYTTSSTLKLHATNVESIGGSYNNYIAYLHYITLDGKLYGVFRQDTFHAPYEEDTSDTFIASNVLEAKVNVSDNGGYFISYQIWYLNVEHQLFSSDLNTSQMVVADVKTFDIVPFLEQASCYIGLNGKVYIYQNSESSLLIDGQFRTLKLVGATLYIIDNNLTLWSATMEMDEISGRIGIANELKLTAKNVLDVSSDGVKLCYIQL